MEGVRRITCESGMFNRGQNESVLSNVFLPNHLSSVALKLPFFRHMTVHKSNGMTFSLADVHSAKYVCLIAKGPCPPFTHLLSARLKNAISNLRLFHGAAPAVRWCDLEHLLIQR
jgi:hypothetical protein